MVSLRALILALSGIGSVMPLSAQAQTMEDVAWNGANDCAAMRHFAQQYPNTRYISQLRARLVSLSCLRPAGSASPLRPRKGPISPAVALLDGAAPPPISDLLSIPVPTVGLVSERTAPLPPCPAVMKPKEACRTEILGLSYNGDRFALSRSSGEFSEEWFRDGKKETYSPIEYSDPLVFGSADLKLRAQLASPENPAPGAPRGTGWSVRSVMFLNDENKLLAQTVLEGATFAWNISTATAESGGTMQQTLQASPGQKYLFAGTIGAGHYCSLYAYSGDYEYLGEYDGEIGKRTVNCSIEYFNASADSETLAVGVIPDGATEDPNGIHDVVAAVRWRDGKQLLEVPGKIGAISPAASHLAVWGPKQGRLPTAGSVYDLWSGKRVFAMTGHPGGVTSLAWSPDGERLATGGADAIVNLWNARTGKQIATFGGFPGPVCSLQFTQRGRGLITQCEKVVRVYDAATGQQLKAFLPGTDGLLAIEVSGDGSTIVEVRNGTRSSPTIQVWHIDG